VSKSLSKYPRKYFLFEKGSFLKSELKYGFSGIYSPQKILKTHSLLKRYPIYKVLVKDWNLQNISYTTFKKGHHVDFTTADKIIVIIGTAMHKYKRSLERLACLR
jgi:hypothetical protein